MRKLARQYLSLLLVLDWIRTQIGLQRRHWWTTYSFRDVPASEDSSFSTTGAGTGEADISIRIEGIKGFGGEFSLVAEWGNE